MADRLKLLWIKSGGLMPLDAGGLIRSYNLIKELAKRHDLRLFLFYPEKDGPDGHGNLAKDFPDSVFLPFKGAQPGTIADYLLYARNLLTDKPFTVARHCKPSTQAALRKHLAENSYDVVIIDFLVTAAIWPWDMNVPNLIFTHNVEAMIWQRHTQIATNPIWKQVCSREFDAISKIEEEYLRRTDHVLTVSEKDSEVFSRTLPRERLTVIPTGVDTDYFRPIDKRMDPAKLVFTGSMDWMPNEDAVAYFAHEILPLIQRERQNTSFWIVGRRPGGKTKELANVNGVKVTGAVDDIRPYMADSAVYVVPLRVGGGTRIKIFEAMAAGKAVVSTTIGAEGLPVTHGKDILIADTPEDFATATLTLMRDAALRDRLGQNARELVEQHYSWGAVSVAFEGAFQKTLQTHRARSASAR